VTGLGRHARDTLAWAREVVRLRLIMRIMKKIWQIVSLGALAAVFVGCTPALNWREVRFEDGIVTALMPCKPDAGQRDVTLKSGDRSGVASLQMRGCEASDFQFTLGQMTLPADMTPIEAMAAWRLASLAPLNVSPAEASAQPWVLRGADAMPTPLKTQVMTPSHRVQWVWFARDGKVYQAGVYGQAQASKLDAVAEEYFAGIKLP
jgi:hypothetical protein